MALEQQARVVQSVTGVSSGKRYAEVALDSLVSGSTKDRFGVKALADPFTFVWLDRDGKLFISSEDPFSSGAPTLIAGDVGNIAIDMSSGALWLGINGTYYYDNLGLVGGGDPAAGTNPTATVMAAPIHVRAGVTRSIFEPVGGSQFSLRTQASQFTGAIPSGFTAWYP